MDNSTLKILHVLSSPRAEGTPKIVLDWLRSGMEMDQEILFLSAKGELEEEFRAIPVWQHYNNSFSLGVGKVYSLIKLVKIIVRERKPDIIICWNSGFSPWVAIGGWLGGCRHLVAHMGNYPGPKNHFKSILHTTISGWTYKLLRGQIICCSKYVMEAYKAMPFSAGTIYNFAYNCVQIEQFFPPSPETSRSQDFIMVATLEGHKDHFTLLKAWSILEKEGMTPNLYLVGDGSYRERLKKEAEEMKLSSIYFLGSRQDVPELLWRSKCFIFSTTSEEGFGTVLIEALAAGCQIMASKVPACEEVLQNGKWGELIEAGSPEKLSVAVKQFISNPIRKGNENQIREYLNNFIPETMIKRYLALSIYKQKNQPRLPKPVFKF